MKNLKTLSNDELMKKQKEAKFLVFISLGLNIALLIVVVYNMMSTRKFDFLFLVVIALAYSNYNGFKRMNKIKIEMKDRSLNNST